MRLKTILTICFTIIVSFFASNSFAGSKKEPVDYVNTDIGGVSILLTATRSVVQLPHDYPQVTPVLNPGITDSYLATKIYGFPAGGVTIMPTTDTLKTDPNRIASSFDRDFETRTPYYYKGLLEDYNIETSYTVGHFAIFYQFDFPSSGNKFFNLMMDNKGWIETDGSDIVQGFTTINQVPYYFYLKFSEPFEIKGTWNYGSEPEKKNHMEGEKIGLTLEFQKSE